MLAAERLFPLLLSNLHDHALFAINLEGHIISWTLGVSRILGYEEAEFLGLPASIIFTPEDCADGIPETEMRRAREDGNTDDIRWHLRKDGTRFWANGQMIALYDELGQIEGYVKVMRDDTERKQVEDARRKNEERQTFLLKLSDALRPLTDSADILLTASRVLGEHVGANRVGYAKAQEDGETIVVTRNYTNGVPGIEGRYHYNDYGPGLLPEFLAGRTVVRPDIANDPSLSDEEKEAHRVLQLGATLNKPLVKAGHLMAVLFVHYTEAHEWTKEDLELLDETAERTWAAVERARAESALRESEARLQKAISIKTAGVLFFDLNGHIHHANEAFERLSGYTVEELNTMVHWENLTPPQFLEATARAAHELATQGVTEPYEKQLVRPDGSRWWGLFAPTRLSGSGKESQCVEFIIDITQNKRAEETLRVAHQKAEEANRLKDEFLGTLSHELRTPLNAILGWSNILSTHELDAQTTKSGMEAIERNARSQAQLIEDLLDVSRILTGKLRLELRPVELAHIVEEAMKTLAPTAKTKEIRLVSQIDHSLGLVLGDPERIRQILWNLLSNAVKFTPRQGRVLVSVEATNSLAQIQISDTGQGIVPEFLPHVFERFRQADASSTRKQGGLGIGLALVRHLVEAHGGTVQVESAGEGQGATFTVTFPLATAQSEIENIGHEPTSQSAMPTLLGREKVAVPPLSGLDILVVDDDPDALNLTSLCLMQHGASVSTATSAAAAFACIKQSRDVGQPFDLLVSDVGMPGEDGLSLIRRVRDWEGGEALPAVALTAYASEKDRGDTLRAGFQMHVTKPVAPLELIATVARLVEETRRDSNVLAEEHRVLAT